MKKENAVYNKTFLMVVSVIVAFLSWLFVAQSSKDTKEKTIQNVTVDMQNVDESIGKLGLNTIAQDQQKVSVNVEGVIYGVGNLKAEDIVVYPDISKITTAGVYSVELKGEIRDKTKNQNVSVTGVSPSMIQLKFDSLENKTLEIKSKLSVISAPDDYLIGNVTFSPSEVNITGPEADISRVYQCVAEKKFTEELTATYNETISLQFLDKDGNQVDLNYITPELTETRVTVPVLKKKIVPVTLSFINVPAGFPIEELRKRFEISNEKIELAGPADLIDKYAEIPLGQIDVKSLDVNKIQSFEVKVPAGFMNTQNIQYVSARFRSDGLMKKKFNVPNILVQNAPVNYEAKATNDTIPDVEVIGPQEVVEAMLAGDVVATVDLQESSSIESGQVELPVKITVPNKGLVWARGDYKAIISIQDRSTMTEEELKVLDEEKPKPAE